MNSHRSFHAPYVVTGFAGLAALLVSGTARADRVYVVEESPREPEAYEGRSSLDLAFDAEGGIHRLYAELLPACVPRSHGPRE